MCVCVISIQILHTFNYIIYFNLLTERERKPIRKRLMKVPLILTGCHSIREDYGDLE